MKIKKIISIVLSGVLVLSLVACGAEKKDAPKKEEINKEETKNEDKKTDTIKKEKDNIFELGKKQTQAIKEVVEKHGIKTRDGKDKSTDAQIVISKDENEASLPDRKGYTITTLKSPTLNDGVENKYSIDYYSTVKNANNEAEYRYQISLTSLGDGTFKLENAKMLKELIQAVDKNYDFGDFDKWVNGFLEKVKADTAVSDGRDHGAFHENIKGEINDEGGKKELFLMYTVTLN
ncbi:hypothetical protein SAMN02745163_03400 [Clostridium cavendishii DSM 21758]|uniref:Lipoprotein n=1 Tax=Clostridium cavendishii DSM 21758 TaxID=1121302 RepID=A0A1M6QH35_9CLOT|nr:hypothetical protein [Clostridium cavendishii]SHK19475.1 hypothetical protein SAMN02745163_03400 [Clostridium cavendishii DSM 21758]